MKRRITTEHSRYVLDYDEMTYTRERVSSEASYLLRNDGVTPHSFTSATITDNGCLYIEDSASGYWVHSTPITSDSEVDE